MRSIVPNQCAASTSRVAAGLNGHAVCGPAVARTLVVEDALGEPISGRAVQRPFWLVSRCPVWCDAADSPSGHANHDAFEDRRHTLFGAEVELTLYPSTIEAADADEVELPALSLMAAQHYLATVPLVSLTVPLPDNADGYAEHELHLTLDETRALRDGLDELLTALTGTEAGAAGGAW